MCGICGIYGVKDEALVRKMVATLRHRGPDDSGIYVDDNISLGHARLSINDLSERGRQPMPNEDGSIWLSVNGAVYNFLELRAELQKRGHHFRSTSDSETIIHTYEEYGLDFLNHLRGMFALALYDQKQKRLILARDPIGKKPLYYHFDGRQLIFASEIKAILEAGARKEIDEAALYAYLTYRYSLGSSTLFRNIKKVLGGEFLVVEPGKLTTKKYWDIVESVNNEADDKTLIERLRALLEDSARLRMIADVPIGAFLSGGIDSGAIVALARQYAKGKFHTFSVGFESFSELEYAKIVSQRWDTAHTELIITADMVAQDLPSIAWHYDEPLGDAAIINNYYLAKEARKHVKVVLAGEGGDELFAGYPNYQLCLRYLNLFHMPSALRTALRASLEFIPGKGNIYAAGDRLHRLASILSQPTLRDALLHSESALSRAEIDYLTRLSRPKIDDMVIPSARMSEPLNLMLAADCKNLLPEGFLMKADKATMANSVEERLPLLDKEIIEYAFTIPPHLKIGNGQEKYILRRAVADLLPPEIVNRRKTGFSTPMAHWLGERRFNEMVIETLSSGELVKNYFKKEAISKLVQHLHLGSKDRATLGWSQRQATVVWIIFALELWYDTFFSNKR